MKKETNKKCYYYLLYKYLKIKTALIAAISF